MTTFVLVHGAFQDGSAWDDVVERMTQVGHTAYAPTVAGHGRGADKSLSHAQCVESVIDYVVDLDLTDFVLVGHSFGGTIVCKVVEAIPERVRRIVFYAGLVLEDGQSVYEASPPDHRVVMDGLMAESADGSFVPPFEIFRAGFMADADTESARRAYERLAPQPPQTFLDRLDMKKFYALQTPRSYVLGTEDFVAPGLFHPQMTNLLGEFRFLQMPGGHQLMFSNPSALADKLIEAATD